MPPNFDRIARPYRWLEYLSLGPMLERCRFYRLPEVSNAKRALVLGDGDGRFLARLLKQNPLLQADVVDLSPAMLRLLNARATVVSAEGRISLHCLDVREYTPLGRYDLVVTHFFLDCLTTEELLTLAARLHNHLCPGARWILSEFVIPPGLFSIPAKVIVRGLYAAFHLLTGLEARSLPDHPTVLRACGLTCVSRRHWLGGLLVSELWEYSGNQPRSL